MIDEEKVKKLIERDKPMSLRETTCKYFCPICNRTICSKHTRDRYVNRINYCPKCGQHLDTSKLSK